MKKLILVFFIFFTATVGAQTYSNNWIDYNKTYYKFTVGKNGLYHINQSTLSNLGLGNIPAEQFQLWRNGAEVTLYTSVSSGPLTASDFIEFWGVMNDGKMDTKMYRNPDLQLSDKYSLQTDTAAYFLTVNTAGNNLRYSNEANNVAGNSLAPEPYFMDVKGTYYRTKINPGYAVPAGLYVYSSSYDIGEGWSSADIYPNQPLAAQINDLDVYSGGPAASLRFGAAGNAYNQRNIKVKFNNTFIDDESMPQFSYVKRQIDNIPLSAFTNPNSALISFQNTSSEQTDRYVVSFVELTYPGKFNFNNRTDYSFELAASTTGKYLVIDNFNYGSKAPVLFDVTSNKRYVGDISVAGKVRFVLPASSIKRKFQITSQESAVVTSVASMQVRNFINYGVASNQGNYLIISNPLLYSSSNGANNVDLYRQYRSSSVGGGFNSKIINVDELTDQFAYGIKKHPTAIKEFIQYAKATFSVIPQYVFLIGKGVTYDDYVLNQKSIYAEKLNLVPTFGSPGSDVLMASAYGSIVPTIPIGRLSAVSGDEIGSYLQKMKDYEQAQVSATQTLASKQWMKNVVHVIGGREVGENDLFTFYMNQYRDIIQDTFYGAKVETFSKSSTAAVQLIAAQRLTDLFKEGISLLTYFGHSSATIMEFNLGDPVSYDNQGKYPFFLVSGCTAGNNYIFDSLRILQKALSISENFVLSKERGSIGFLASSHLGIPPYLHSYNDTLYKLIGKDSYGNSIGNNMRTTIFKLGGDNSLDPLSRMNLEELNLHGDPALKINPHPKPDYVVEDQQIKISPTFISVAESNFTMDAKIFNIGRAVNDSINVTINRTYPSGTNEMLLRKRIKGIGYADSLKISIPVIATRDKGLNKITVTVDADNEVPEISETNNSFTKEVFIYEDEATPAYPHNYAIVNVANQKLIASTANPVSDPKDYVMEIDTTQLFNSAAKVSRTLRQAGGVLEFDPGFSYTNNRVYYWRVALKPASNLPKDFHWNGASFTYLSNSTPGSAQSHYYQHLASDTQNIKMDTTRKWKFSTVTNFLEMRNAVYPTGGDRASDCMVGINGWDFTKGICSGENNIIFNVVNPLTLKPWYNVMGQAVGLSGSDPACIPERSANFAFTTTDQNKRKAAMRFLDSIPDNYIVMVRNVTGPDSLKDVFANTWLADTLAFGSGNSLYHRLKSAGFVLIDSFNRPRAFTFMYQKNNPDFEPNFVFSQGITDKIEFKKNHITQDTLGYMTSPKFGPATAWKEIHWNGTSMEANSADRPTVQVIGIDATGKSSVLFDVDNTKKDLDISSVNARQYPFIQLKMRNSDSIYTTPFQLSYWRLNYTPAPEGAIAANLFFTSKDTLVQGETLNFGIAFKNISAQKFDSMRIKLSIIDNNNNTHLLTVPRQKPLISGDTITFKFAIDTKLYSGANTLMVDFNPDNDQPEQFHFNNFLYRNFYVKSDRFNPLLDVTFDGVHILNRDIISSRPQITIKLKDESSFLALNDTSLMKVQIRSADGNLRTYHFDNDTMRFIPANLSSGENTATIQLSPILTGEDEEYELIVSGKDAAGNKAGELDYHVSFRVISKPMISNLLNYPNPFTTSTAFVFTITGAVVPQNIRIQILTVTGKVIREITKEELGPLHIGRNVTEFKWDGSDMFGQKVANGVYLYRVLTNLNGKSLEKYTAEGDKTDKYFTRGYGKMYFMR